MKLNKEFSAQCAATSSQSVDEAIIGFKGRSTLKQYMPLKLTKCGYKMWVRSNDTTGYMSECEIYTGKAEGNEEYGLGGHIMTDVSRSILHKNIQITFDNFFASFPLMEKLYNDGIYATATVRSVKKQLLNTAPEKLSLQAGESEWRTCSHTGYVQWKDMRFVHILSTAFAPHKRLMCKGNRRMGQPLWSHVQSPLPDILNVWAGLIGSIKDDNAILSAVSCDIGGSGYFTFFSLPA